MMDPRYERLRVIGIAAERATEIFEAPVDRIVIRGASVEAWSGARRVRGTCDYHNAYDQHGGAMPGSGNWSVTFGNVEVGVTGWVGRAMAKLSR